MGDGGEEGNIRNIFDIFVGNEEDKCEFFYELPAVLWGLVWNVTERSLFKWWKNIFSFNELIAKEILF